MNDTTKTFLNKIRVNTYIYTFAFIAAAGLYIVNPLKKTGMKISDLSSTHPPISKRIRILRGMTHGVNFIDYQDSYNKIKGSSETIIPASGLNLSEDIAIRGEFESVQNFTKKETQRKLGDIVMNVNKYKFYNCNCGVTIKIPPTFKDDKIKCPRCGEVNKED